MKTMLTELKKFVLANYPTGIQWNASGSSLADAISGGSSGSAASSGGPPPPPPGPPADPHRKDEEPKQPAAASSGGGGGMSGVMNAIRGANVTSGLKKVEKSQMTHKNPALRDQALQPKEKPKTDSSSDKKTSSVSEAKREPKLYLNKGTWFVEHYDGGDIVTIPEVQIKESIYIMKCKNVTVSIPDKCKSIQVDNCSKINVVFKNVVSIFECFNSQRVAIECTEACPSLAIDKSAGCSITLSRAAIKAPPYIVTSSITELNLVVPGKTDEDDPIEIPLPEQYVTLFDPKTNSIKTESSSSLG
jgi:adenylyl cyclase-associated protein